MLNISLHISITPNCGKASLVEVLTKPRIPHTASTDSHTGRLLGSGARSWARLVSSVVRRPILFPMLGAQTLLDPHMQGSDPNLWRGLDPQNPMVLRDQSGCLEPLGESSSLELWEVYFQQTPLVLRRGLQPTRTRFRVRLFAVSFCVIFRQSDFSGQRSIGGSMIGMRRPMQCRRPVCFTLGGKSFCKCLT